MRRIKRYPLLRQEAFDDDDRNQEEELLPLELDGTDNIYMINPDLICIFNTIPAELEKPEAPPSVKRHKSAEDANNPTRPVVVGGSIIFSNSFDGYISPTLIEKYESLANRGGSNDQNFDKEKESNNSADHEMPTEDEGANSDIISFSAALSRAAAGPVAQKPAERPEAEENGVGGPFISSYKRDVITFFLTDIGRQKTMEEEMSFEGNLLTETVGETTPDCVTSEESNKESCSDNNKDIISFSATARGATSTARKLSYSLSVPQAKSKSDLRKPYISLNFSDIISFYNSEESLLQAYSKEPTIVKSEEVDKTKEVQTVVDDEEPTIEETKENPDRFVFYNDRSAPSSTAPVATSTPKPSRAKKGTPMMIHQGSIISFYSDEPSFLSALEPSLLTNDIESTEQENIETDSTLQETPDNKDEDANDAENTHNKDIKVFSNRTSDLEVIGQAPCSSSRSKPRARRTSPILIVTREFPDIISFYNPNSKDSSFDISEATAPEDKNEISPSKQESPKRSASAETAEFGTIELSQSNDQLVAEYHHLSPPPLGTGICVEPPELATSPLDYTGTMWARPGTRVLDLEPPHMATPKTTRERLPVPAGSPCLEEPELEDQAPRTDEAVHIVDMNGREEADDEDDMPGLEEVPDSVEEDDSQRNDSSAIVEDSLSEDGTPIRNVQDIEHLLNIEKAIDMIDAIKDMDFNYLAIAVPEPIDDEYLYEHDEFEKDLTDEIDSLISEAERLMEPRERDTDAYSEDLEHFFDDVNDPEEPVLKTEPDEVAQLKHTNIVIPHNGDPEISPRDSVTSESAIITFITQNIDKYMELSPDTDTPMMLLPDDIVDVMDDAQTVIAAIDDVLDGEDYPEVPGWDTPRGSTPSPPATPTVTRRLVRVSSLEVEADSDSDSDTVYNTMYEALNKPVLPPIPRLLCDDNPLPLTRSLTSLDDYNRTRYETPKLYSSKSWDEDSKVLSPDLLSEIVQHPLTAPETSSVKRSRSTDHVTRPREPLGEACLFFLQNNIGASTRDDEDDREEEEEEKPKKSPERSKIEPNTSPLSRLAQTIVDRISSHVNDRDKKVIKSIKSSDVIKLDRQIFSDIQKKFSKPKEKMSSLRSKYKNRKKGANKWTSVQVVPHQVDISYNEVNPVDVEVPIPDIIERRTPIAKLFNDTSPPPAKSPSPTGARIVSPRPNVFMPIEIPKRRYPSPKILRRVAMFEGLALIDSRRRPVSPGPESKYLGSLDNLADKDSHGCECESHPPKLTRQSRNWVSQDSGLYDGTLKPVSARKPPNMFQPTWRKNTPSPDPADRPRSTSPHWQSFSEAAFGVNGTYAEKHVPPSVRHPSRSRILSCESNRENKIVQNSIGSQTNTHVDRLARSGSAASLAVVMASTFPNGGDANFDLEGTAAKISEVCKSLSNSQNDATDCGSVHLTRSRSVNSGIDVIHSPEVKTPTQRPIFFDRNNSSEIRIRTTPESRVGQPMKAKKATTSYKMIKELQEKLKEAEIISYHDMLTCPRNRLPPHIDKLQLQKYLSDTEFVDVFNMAKEEFNKLPPWKQAHLKKETSLF